MVAENDTPRKRARAVQRTQVDQSRQDLGSAAAASRANADALPEQLGAYRVVGRLGEGAMGEVFEARSSEDGQPNVAIKIVRGVAAEGLYRFKQEFRALADVRHRNVIRLYELGHRDDRLFFSMELVHGTSFVDALCGPARTGNVHDAAADFDRVRDAMRQLAGGVHAIHAAGFMHRDLKPSNVMVEPTGRVVILDFGLVRDINNTMDVGVTADGALLGTPLFMSPEQVRSEPITPASDWYTVGEMLYQVLTGRPPFSGKSMIALLTAKRDETPVPPSVINPDIPRDLEDLCVALMRREPSARPSGPDVLRSLGVAASDEDVQISHDELFVGREAETAALLRALPTSRAGQPVAILLEGASGIGKTALVQHFIDSARRRNAVVLTGRCSERESIPYQALDSAIDMLSVYLRSLPAETVKAVLPRNVSIVARLFPVLRSVPAIAHAPQSRRSDLQPHELRRRGIGVLRELLGRIADDRPLVLHIDDCQWSDRDSLVVLSSLLSDFDAPPMVLICSFRDDAPKNVPFLGTFIDELGTIEPPIDIRRLRLGPISEDAATRLAHKLLGEDTDERAREVARESAGLPLFVAQLARAQRQDHTVPRAGDDPSVDAIIRARLHALTPTQRRLLHVLAVGGGRLPTRVAVGLSTENDVDRLPDSLHAVVDQSLVHVDSGGPEERLELDHDRIRETVFGDLSRKETAALHLELARVLASRGDADDAVLSHHYREAGELDAATRYAIAAADKAADALAFDQAAKLYESALEDSSPDFDVGMIEERLGDALANAGRQYEAAQAFLRATELVDAAKRPILLRTAAELMLTSGHATEGREVLQRMLAAFGMELPQTRSRAIMSLLAQRAALKVRGLGFKVASPEDVDADTIDKLDACWTASRGLIYSDGLVGALFHARHLRLALRCGDPIRICRALGAEAHLLASLQARRGRSECLGLVDRAAELATSSDSEYALGMTQQARGHVHLMLGEWSEAQHGLDEAVSTFRDLGRGATQEIGYCEIHAALCLQLMGDIRGLGKRAQTLLHESTLRAHPYAQGYARAILGHLVYLADDRVDDAREQLELYHEELPVGFQAHVLNYLDTRSALMRYEGQADQAWDLWSQWRERVQAFDILRSPFPKGAFHTTSMLNALAMAHHASADIEQHFDQAERDAKALIRIDLRHTQGFGHVGLASIARARGHVDTERRQLELALAEFEAASMRLHACIAQHRLASIVGGSEADTLHAKAETFLKDQRIARPDRLFEMLAPIGAS